VLAGWCLQSFQSRFAGRCRLGPHPVTAMRACFAACPAATCTRVAGSTRPPPAFADLCPGPGSARHHFGNLHQPLLHVEVPQRGSHCRPGCWRRSPGWQCVAQRHELDIMAVPWSSCESARCKRRGGPAAIAPAAGGQVRTRNCLLPRGAVRSHSD